MTSHVHAPVLKSRSEIAERAREIHPLKFAGSLILTVIAVVFISIGWVFGAIWFVSAYSVLWVFSRVSWLWQCIRLGYHTGARVKVVPKQQE